ncbi:hypothetical protein ACNQ16_03065 [Mycoplasma sp. 3137]|uniref:hypothetical protein n=1 Tax=Mycoplasma sp. 3137 TaxID=3401687 RepID=UPI003AAD0176
MLDKKMAPEIRFKGFNAEWEIAVLSDFIDYERPDKYIEKLPLLEFGQIPVLTANKLFKLGYTESQNYYTKGDCILFDDFTLDSKYVDFPFMVVSSALKILSLKNSQDSLPYYFGILKNNTFESQGHARHYISIVAKTPIKISNSIEERNLIGSFFTYTDSLIQFQEQKLKKLQTIKQSLLNKMFASGDQKMPEIRFKGFDQDWKRAMLSDCLDYERPDKYIEKLPLLEFGQIPVLTANKSFKLGYTESQNYYAKGDCILFDDFTLDSKYVDFPFMVVSSALKILSLKNSRDSLPYYFAILKNNTFESQGHARHYISIVAKTPIKISDSIEERNLIGLLFTNLDSLIHSQEQKLEKLNNIKQALLEKMFC